MINVYPSKLEGEPIEVHTTAFSCSISDWLGENIPSFREMDAHPISVHVNDCRIEPSEWPLCFFKPSDKVDIYPEPKAAVGAFIVAYGAYIAAAVAVLAVLLMPKVAIPKTGGNASGDPLQDATAKGNQIKINDVIREAFGRNKIFPDYLIPPHRYYESSRQQVVDLFLCVGIGEFDVEASKILIGDTPMVSLGDTASYAQYAPGADVSGDPRATWWHTSEEVGVSSTGSTGLELVTTFSVEQTASANSYIFNGESVTVPDGAGYFPIGWANGMLVRIEVARTYTVVDGGGSVRDTIQGVEEGLGAFVGMRIEVVGDNSGTYVIHSVNSSGDITLDYPDGSPVFSLDIGPSVMSIGYVGLRYRITAIADTNTEDDVNGASTMTLERLTDTGGTDEDWPGFDYYTTADAELTLDASTTDGDWKGPFAACPDGEVTNEVEIDITFPAGLIEIDKKGRSQLRSVTVEWQWRNLATAGAWASAQETFTFKNLDALGFTRKISIPAAYQPEVRMRRIGAKSTSAQVQDTVQWASLKSRLSSPSSYAGVTSMAFKIRGGDRVSTQTESRVSVVCTRKLPVYQGGTWSAPKATRDVFPAVAYIAKNIGYSYDKLNLSEFARIQSVLSARSDYYDNLVETASTVKDSMNTALKVGFSELTVERGTLRPARDSAREVWEQMYSPQNMTKALERSFSAFSVDDNDGVDVEYRSGISWKTETVKCRLPGDLGVKPLKVQLEGVTDRDRAWRYGMRARCMEFYRRHSYKFSTELDAFNSRYLSFVMLADAVPGYAQSGFIKYFDGDRVLGTSEKLNWSGLLNTISLRRPDGTLSGPYQVDRISDTRLRLKAPLDFVPDLSGVYEDPQYIFGEGYPALITSVAPNGKFGASVTAVNYDPRVYAYDNGIADN